MYNFFDVLFGILIWVVYCTPAVTFCVLCYKNDLMKDKKKRTKAFYVFVAVCSALTCIGQTILLAAH